MDNLFSCSLNLFLSFTLALALVFSLLFLFFFNDDIDSFLSFEKQKQEPNFLKYFNIAQAISSDKLLLSINSETASVAVVDNELTLVNNSNTFYTKGLLSTVLYPSYATDLEQNLTGQPNSENQTSETIFLYAYPKLVSGTWLLNVSKGSVIDFQTSFKLLGINGIDKHFIEIMNFQNSNDDSSSVVFDQFSNTSISGFADIKIDNEIFENKFPIKIQIFKINTIVLTILDDEVGNIFYNNDLLGITDSFKNFKNEELLIFDDDDNDDD